MKVTRVSDWSGIERTLDLDITEEQMKLYAQGELVQRAFPQLSDDEREFILTGMTHEEWEQMALEMEAAEDAQENDEDFTIYGVRK